MARTHMSNEEHDMVSLILESQPVTPEDLFQLSAIRLGLSHDAAWQLFTSLLSRQVIATTNGKVSVREDSEELQEVELEQAMARAEADESQRRADNSSTPRGRMFNQKTPPPRTPPPPKQPMSNGTTAPSSPPPPAPEAPAEAEKPRLDRRKVALTAGILTALAAVIAVVVAILLRPPTYPRTVRSGGRELTLLTAPQGRAEQAAEKWLIKFVKGRTDAAPLFSTLTISDMRVYELSQQWDAEAVPTAEGDNFDPAYNFQGTVVFVDALAAGAPEPEEGTAYQYRIYLKGDEEEGYKVYACRSCPAAWVECYDRQDFQVGGQDASLALYGERTERGYRLRVVTLERTGRREILYLNEDEGTDYDQQVHLMDINGDGELDMTVDDRDGQQMCYLFDKEADDYQFFAPLSGGYVTVSPALLESVLFARLDGEDVTAWFYRWGEGTELTELARMEYRGTGAGGRVCEYFSNGASVQKYTLDSAVLAEGLGENQKTLFNQYMAYAYWDELVLERARTDGCLVLPEEPAPAEEWQALTMLADYPDEGMSLYVSPSGLLLTRRGEWLQVLPCSFAGQHPMPTVSDLDWDGDLDILLPFNDITPALLMACWSGEEWILTGFDMSTLQQDFKDSTTLAWTRRGVQLNYEGAYGNTSVLWKGGEVSEGETGTPTLDIKSYALSAPGGNTITLTFPVRIEREDGSIIESELKYTTDVMIPREGVPEPIASRLK